MHENRQFIKTGGQSADRRSYVKYVDPDNPKNVYVRGAVPGWLKEKMRSAGFDPGSKEDRETFKSQHLKKIQG